jgi:hypothetical protein
MSNNTNKAQPEKQKMKTRLMNKPIKTDGNGELLCPICGFGYHHMRNLDLKTGAENRAEITDLRIEIDGECGHRWSLTLIQYKGRLEATASADEQEVSVLEFINQQA